MDSQGKSADKKFGAVSVVHNSSYIPVLSAPLAQTPEFIDIPATAYSLLNWNQDSVYSTQGAVVTVNETNDIHAIGMNVFVNDSGFSGYVTNTYPYVLACFTGTPDNSFNK